MNSIAGIGSERCWCRMANNEVKIICYADDAVIICQNVESTVEKVHIGSKKFSHS
jgi:hypothetical protein